jgi:hypothetical protein
VAPTDNARTELVRRPYTRRLEQYGIERGYLPVLEAIRQLSREDPHVIDVLRAQAPMWLMQMPSRACTSLCCCALNVPVLTNNPTVLPGIGVTTPPPLEKRTALPTKVKK